MPAGFFVHIQFTQIKNAGIQCGFCVFICPKLYNNLPVCYAHSKTIYNNLTTVPRELKQRLNYSMIVCKTAASRINIPSKGTRAQNRRIGTHKT